jgi:hypothetical protein
VNQPHADIPASGLRRQGLIGQRPVSHVVRRGALAAGLLALGTGTGVAQPWWRAALLLVAGILIMAASRGPKLAARAAAAGDAGLIATALVGWVAQAAWPLVPVPLFVAGVAVWQCRLTRVGGVARWKRPWPWLVTAGLCLGASAGVWWWLTTRSAFSWVRLGEPLASMQGHRAWWLAVGVVAVVNAVAEECVWRDAMPSMLAAGGIAGPPAAVVSSVSFGLAHLGAVPGGLGGVVLTTVFGVAALWGNRVTTSVWCSVAAHTAADVVLLAGLASAR